MAIAGDLVTESVLATKTAFHAATGTACIGQTDPAKKNFDLTDIFSDRYSRSYSEEIYDPGPERNSN